MTDFELLAYAGKAAGMHVIRSRLDDPLCKDFLVNGSMRNTHHESGPWNPLTDDGDALRLAVKLRIDIIHYQSGVLAELIGNDDCHEDNGTDPFAATRRAIVRAAAEIGKAMP